MRRCFVWLLCFALLTSAMAADAFAIEPAYQVQPEKAAHVRKMLEPLGTGREAIIAVRLKDKSVVSGFVGEVGPDSFVVLDGGSQKEQTVFYSQVVRLQGYNVATGTEVHEGTGFGSRLVRAVHHVMPTPQVHRNSLTGGQRTLLIGIVVGIVIAIVLAKAL